MTLRWLAAIVLMLGLAIQASMPLNPEFPTAATEPLPSYFRTGILDFESRVWAQTQIDRVYYNHRIWPKQNPGPKPAFEARISLSEIRHQVSATVMRSAALAMSERGKLTPARLQAESRRMAEQTRAPAMLLELFHSLRDDPFLIAEVIARETLLATADHLQRDTPGEPDAGVLPSLLQAEALIVNRSSARYVLPRISTAACPFQWKPLNQKYPLSRNSHSAVWTGTEMIIWGGLQGSSTNTGYRYSPAVDAWAKISNGIQVPSPRYGHFAFWTGSEMLVWGGRNESAAYFNDGGLYSPITNSWRATAMDANTPEGRDAASAVWSGNEMIVWGGNSITTGFLNTGARFSPAANGWLRMSTGADTPAGRHMHTAVWTGSEMIIWGGWGAVGAMLNNGARYAPASDSWTPVAVDGNTPAARVSYTAIWSGTQMIIWGGRNAGYQYLGTGARYDPSLNSWFPLSSGANAPSGRMEHTAVWTGTKMLIFGGINGFVPDGASYDPVADQWQPVGAGANAPSSRTGHTAIWTGNEMIVWGGYGGSVVGARYNPDNDTWAPVASADASQFGYGWPVWTGAEIIMAGDNGARYIPATDSWAPINRTGAARVISNQSAIWTGLEVILWGGSELVSCWPVALTIPGKPSSPDTTCVRQYNTGSRYNPGTDSWTATSTGAGVPAARGGHTALWTGTEMLVWGGGDGLNGTSGARYSPASNAWQPMASSAAVISGRSATQSIWSGSELIVWGGFHYGGSPSVYTMDNTGARYKPATDAWQAIPAGTGTPSARTGHSAIWTGSEMIVWGGYTLSPSGSLNQQFNDGSRYQPSTGSWQPIAVNAVTPSARTGHSAVWSGSEMLIWGGQYYGSIPQIYGDGAGYTPATNGWAPIAITADTPSPSYGHRAFWSDSLGMIIWKGYDGAAYNQHGPPQFTGLASAGDGSSSACSIVLAWPPAASCTGSVVAYNIYRGTTAAFFPAAGNRIAGGVQGSGYTDFNGLTNGVTYYYIVRAQDGNGAEDTNSVSRSATPTGNTTPVNISDSFEGVLSGGGFDNAGWTHQALSGTMDWSWSSAQSKSPTHAWYSQSQAIASDRGLTSPAYKLTSNSTLSFWHTYSFQNPPFNPLCQDAGLVEISTDGGASWGELPAAAMTVGAYNGAVDSTSNPLYGKSAWCGGAIGAMTQVSINLAAYAGQIAQVRWHAGDDNAVARTGWYIDSVTFNSVQIPGMCGTCNMTAMSAMKPEKSGSDLRVTWNVLAGANAYNIYRTGLAPNPYTWGAPAATAAGTVSNWIDAGQLTTALTAFYTVTDVNACGAESPR